MQKENYFASPFFAAQNLFVLFVAYLIIVLDGATCNVETESHSQSETVSKVIRFQKSGKTEINAARRISDKRKDLLREICRACEKKRLDAKSIDKFHIGMV